MDANNNCEIKRILFKVSDVRYMTFRIFCVLQVLILNVKTGEGILSSYNAFSVVHISPLSVSMEGYGNDLLLCWSSECHHYNTNIEHFQIVNGIDIQIAYNIDSCKKSDSDVFDCNDQQQALQLSFGKTYQPLQPPLPPVCQPQKRERNLIWKIKEGDDVKQINLPFQNSNDEEDNRNVISDEPISYVRRFLTDELLQNIVDESNKYALQKNIEKNLHLDKNELEQFIGILYLMSIVRLPSTRMYWSNELYFEKLASVITLNRFEKIKLFLRCNDDMQRPENCTDKLYKIRPIVNMLKESFISLKHEEIMCIDEQVVPFKGRSLLKQYNPQKPKKWVYKFYILASIDGLVHNFEIHSVSIDVCKGQPDLKASGYIVMHLLVNVQRHKWHKLFFDNWYTGLELIKTLYDQGIACTGTVRTNRLPNLNMPTDGELKKEGRGSTAIRVTSVDNVELRAVKWFDNRGVALLTSYEAVNPITIVNRWDRKYKKLVQVKRPSVVTTYNNYMGGVDLLDGMLRLYRIHI
ncbi:piggyBac transposable element-derived protein 3-like [Hydra vulgaris]|uniref:PiggyBac transposable element-derived protein 3-like n=1 Tax=Hydra vulgaris TaxID=6087 RepID=A0ABM4CSD1_HYDVU